MQCTRDLGCLQVLLVAGGMDSPYDDPFSSTEVLTSDSPAWTMATPLTRAVWGVKGVTVSNILYLTGKLQCALL